MSAYYAVLTLLSVLLLALASTILRRAWRLHAHDTSNPDTEHGLVAATGYVVICMGLTMTSAGQALGIGEILSAGSAIVRASLVTTLVYLVLRDPHR